MIKSLISKAIFGIKYILSPPFCSYCRIFMYNYTVFCNQCSELIKPVISKKLAISKNYNITVFAVSDYKAPIKQLILAKSKRDQSASVLLAQLIWDYSVLKNIEFDYLVPVPLHWMRKSWRGYNQSEVIASELSSLTGKQILNCLKRTKRTKFQSSVPANQRESNVKDAFDIVNLNLNLNLDLTNKTLVLVDDLMTTGSTLKSAAKALLKYKPKAIYAIVACYVCS